MAKEQLKELQKAYAAQLERKDREIEELRQRNDFLMMTALKQSEKAKQWEDVAKRAMKSKKN